MENHWEPVRKTTRTGLKRRLAFVNITWDDDDTEKANLIEMINSIYADDEWAVKFLLDCDVDPYAYDEAVFSQTPIEWAIFLKRWKILQILQDYSRKKACVVSKRVMVFPGEETLS